MIDLFEINHYLKFMMSMYTGLDMSFLYNAQMNSCRFSCNYLHDPVYESKVWLFYVSDTQAAIDTINIYVLDFLAVLASHGVSFSQEEKNMRDLIDRKAALTAICAKCPKLGHCPNPCVAHRALRDMPSSRSIKECSEAHWIDAGHGFYSCEACKRMKKERSEFCPNCGAKMQKEVLKKWP